MARKYVQPESPLQCKLELTDKGVHVVVQRNDGDGTVYEATRGIRDKSLREETHFMVSHAMEEIEYGLHHVSNESLKALLDSSYNRCLQYKKSQEAAEVARQAKIQAGIDERQRKLDKMLASEFRVRLV